MADAILVSAAPKQFQVYLKKGDDAGNKNGVIDTPQEAQAAAEAACSPRTLDCKAAGRLIKYYGFQLNLPVFTDSPLKKLADKIAYSSIDLASLKSDPEFNDKAREDIIKIIERAGEADLDAGEIRSLFDKASAFARRLKDDETRAYSLFEIAGYMRNYGYEKKEVFDLCKEALVASKNLKPSPILCSSPDGCYMHPALEFRFFMIRKDIGLGFSHKEVDDLFEAAGIDQHKLEEEAGKANAK